MKAVILSAGQGSRLLPLTENTPKCLLEVGGKTALDWQLDILADCGIQDIVVVAGFGEGQVCKHLADRPEGPADVRVRYNPFYKLSDNLATCWLVRDEFEGDCLLINGDTLFSAPLCRSLTQAKAAPVTVTIDRKDTYDADDMKVITDGGRLLDIGKSLALESVTGEAIGMIRFQAGGGPRFAETLDEIIREQHSTKKWYLSAVSRLASQETVCIHSIEGHLWGEIDDRSDLARAAKLVAEKNFAE